MDLVAHILVPVAMVASGMTAGGMMIAVLGAPLLLALEPVRYVALHQLLVTRFDPFMPACLLTALVTDAALAVVAPHTWVRVLYVAGAVLLLVTATISVTKNVPINKWLKTLDPEALPADFDRLLHRRVVWRNWNLVRSSFALTALVVNGAAVGVLL